MGKYEKLAKDIVEHVGGKENIVGLIHCVTRLRFTLKDESQANDEVIKNMEGVVTLMKSGGYYQVVIGNHVPDVYKEVVKVAGLSGDSSSIQKENRKFSDKALDMITSIFAPSLALLCACGMIKGLNSILAITGLVAPSSGLGVLLAALGDVMFYYMPVFVGYNLGVKLGLNKYVAMGCGLALVYPTITGSANELVVFGINATGLNYSSTVLPVIAVVVIAYYLQEFFNKIIPDVVKTFLTPMFVLLIAVPLGYLIIGPVANNISAMLYAVINGIIGVSPILAGAIIAFFWQILVIFGVHQAVIVPSIIALSSGLTDSLLAMVGPAPFAQMAVVLAMWMKTKNTKRRSLQLPAWISGVFGVTEPAIYGFTLPNMKLFIAGCIAAAIGGAYLGLMNVQAITLAGLGVFGFPGFIAPEGLGNLYHYLIGCGISIILAMVFTFILYKEEDANINTEAAAKAPVMKKKGKTETVHSPLLGKSIPLAEINDAAFSEGALGEGVAVIPESGDVYAPVNGTITTLFPTKHAIGITSEDGAEILIHIGLNTVELNGTGFNNLVSQGDKVKQGQKILTFDLTAIQEKGYDTTTAIVVTNTKDYLDVVPLAQGNVKNIDKLIELIY